ncbi:hypothetical protein JUNP479_1597 [Aeromonas jandaei]|nr:hypothetical protein JUNP479_1597 [Aeromonas jandaei]
MKAKGSHSTSCGHESVFNGLQKEVGGEQDDGLSVVNINLQVTDNFAQQKNSPADRRERGRGC